MAAQRFGGEFSPDGQAKSTPKPPKFRNRAVAKGRLRANLLFFVPLPLLLSGISALGDGDAAKILASFGSFGLMILSAWLLREGLRAEEAYDARHVARPPAFPRKAFAATLTGAGIFLAAWFGWQQGIVTSVILALVGAGAHVGAFGLDPFRRKGMQGVSDFQADRVATAVEKAEILVAQTMDAARRIGDRGIEARVEQLAAAAREVFRTVEQDPQDLPRARKFLSVYLMGARDATVKFADLYSRSRDQNARRNFEALLSDLETSFASQREKLLENNRSDLDIEIEVLRERLQQEGLTAR